MRTIRVLLYTLAGTVVALFGWSLLVVGGILFLLYGADAFPRTIFWSVTAISAPIYFVVLYRYFDRTQH